MIVKEKSYRSKDAFAQDQNQTNSQITLKQFKKMKTFVRHYPRMSKKRFYGIILNKEQLVIYSHNALMLLETPNRAIGFPGQLTNFTHGTVCFGTVSGMSIPKTAMMLLEYYGKTQ